MKTHQTEGTFSITGSVSTFTVALRLRRSSSPQMHHQQMNKALKHQLQKHTLNKYPPVLQHDFTIKRDRKS